MQSPCSNTNHHSICSYSEDTLLTDLVCDEGLQVVVGDLLKLLDSTDMCADDGLLLLVDSDCAEYLGVRELLVLEVL